MADLRLFLPVLSSAHSHLRARLQGFQEILLPPARTSVIAMPEPDVETWIRRGGAVFLVMFGGFLSWSLLAPIASAALGTGAVKVETARKTIQHAEGGILRDILVREGMKLHKGDILFRLDSVDAEAERDTLQSQYDVLLARQWRLDGLSAQPQNLGAEPLANSTRMPAALDAQRRLFDEQRDSTTKQVDIWQRRKDQYAAQIEAAEAHLASLEAQKPSLDEELADSRTMLAKGYGLKPKVLALERQVEAMKGESANDKGKIFSLREQVAEADAQILSILATLAKQVAEERQEVNSKVADTEEALKKSVARAGRRDVVAPVDGIAMNVRSFTQGGVIAPGGPMVDIVPSGEKLLIEARLQLTDIAVVRPDLDAQVRLSAYKQRTTPSLTGKVLRVSADAQVDEKTGQSFYTATIEVPPEELARVPHVKLYPGMPVDVSITTGARSLFAYLMQPLSDSLSHSFREN